MLELLNQLNKNGVKLWISEAGVNEIMRLMNEEQQPIEEREQAV